MALRGLAVWNSQSVTEEMLIALNVPEIETFFSLFFCIFIVADVQFSFNYGLWAYLQSKF